MASSQALPLPIVATVRGAWGEVVHQRRALFEATIVPAAVASAMSAGAAGMDDAWIRNGVEAVTWALWSLLAVSCHRIILVGEDSLPGTRGIYWTSRETRFALWGVVALTPFAIALLAPMLLIVGGLTWLAPDLLESPSPTIQRALTAVSMLVGVWGVARASFILPSIAIDRREPFWNVWMLSHGHDLRVTVITMSLPALLLAIAVLDFKYMPHRSFFPIAALRWAFYFVASVFEIALLSVAYRELMARRAPLSAS